MLKRACQSVANQMSGAKSPAPEIGASVRPSEALKNQPLPAEITLAQLREYRAAPGQRSTFSVGYDALAASLDPERRSVPVPELSRAVHLDDNKRLRHGALKQSLLTNRFTGSPAATLVEREFAALVTRYQVPSVRKRLAVFSLLVAVGTQIEGLVEPAIRGDLANILLRTVGPVGLQLLAAGILGRARGRWRRVVMGALFVAHLLIMVGMATVSFYDGEVAWTEWRLYFHVTCMLGWLVLYLLASALLFALDFVQLLLLLPALWISNVVASAVAFARWWDATGGPDNGAAGRRWSDRVDGTMLYCFCIALSGLLILLYAVRATNRFERLGFVNSCMPPRALKPRALKRKQTPDPTQLLLLTR